MARGRPRGSGRRSRRGSRGVEAGRGLLLGGGMRSFVPASTRCARSGPTLRGRSTAESPTPSGWKPTSSWPAILSLLLVMGGPFFVAPTSGDTKTLLAHAPDAPLWRRVDAGSTTASTRGHGWRGRGRRSAEPGQMTNRGQRVPEGHRHAIFERAELVARASTTTRGPPRSRRPPRAYASTRARMRARHASPPASSGARRRTQRRCNGGGGYAGSSRSVTSTTV